MSKDMPPEITSIRDAVIDHAHRGTPLPENIDELYEWLLIYKIYGRPLDEMTYDFYFHLTSIEFRDEYKRQAFMAGQGGIEMNWDGCFESREKYIEYLRNEQGMCDSAEIDLISDADILALWEYE